MADMIAVPIKVRSKDEESYLNYEGKPGTSFHHHPFPTIVFKNNFEIYIDRVRAFVREHSQIEYDYQNFYWEIRDSEQVLESKPVELSYNELIDLGFRIYVVPAKDFFPGTRTKQAFVLCRADENPKIKGSFEYQNVPPDCRLEFDSVTHSVRIVGQYVVKREESDEYGWVAVNEKEKVNKKEKSDIFEKEFQDLGMMTGDDSEIRLKKIVDLPLGYLENGSMLALPERKDEPVIGIMGQKGKGKTFLSHQIIDFGFNMFRKNFMILNDINNETTTWWKKSNFRTNMLEKIHAKPTGLPMIYLYPNTYDLEDGEIYKHRLAGFRFTFPFNDFIRNYQLYTHGNKKWNLPDASAGLLDTLSEEIAKCKSEEEVMRFLDFKKEESQNKEMSIMIATIKRKFNLLFKMKIFDINTKIPSKWQLRDGIVLRMRTGLYNPFFTTMVAGGIPVLMTSKIRQHGFFEQYFYYILNNFYDKVKNDTRFKNMNGVWLFCDEITELAPRQESKQGVCHQVLGKLAREGRMNKVGLIWSTQLPEDVSPDIYSNTTYSFIFYMKGNQADAIKHEYRELDERFIKKIGKLDKMQFIATTSESFVIYTPDGKRQEKNADGSDIRGPFICTSIAPLSSHKPPVSGKEKIEDDSED